MKTLLILVYVFISMLSGAAAASDGFKVNWLTVSDENTLRQTWDRALVFLPQAMGGDEGRLIQNGRLEEAVDALADNRKVPLILFMHYCEGLGHHWEDMRRLSKLGFIVVGPDSFARTHRPLGCYEDKARFIRYFDAAVAMRKAELDYAVQKLAAFDWIDRSNLFLFGSGLGGLAVAHYEGDEFAGHLIEGWGCRGPNPVFDGIWAPPGVRVFTTVSRNAPFLTNNPGFSVDCTSFLEDRPGSVSVVIDRPAHQVSWYPSSFQPMIRFLLRDMNVDIEDIAEDRPIILEQSPSGIQLVEKWSDAAVYEASREHCTAQGKQSRLTAEPRNGVYTFACD